MNLKRLLPVVAALPLSLASCLAPVDDETIAEDREALRGYVVNPKYAVVKVVINGSNRVWTGTLLEPDLVLVAGDLPTSTPILGITAQMSVDAAHPSGTQSRIAANFLHNPQFNVALIKLQQPFTGSYLDPIAFDGRPPATLNGIEVACQGYRSGTSAPIGFNASVTNATGTGFTLFSTNGANVGVDPGDLAVPCFDLEANDGMGTLVGVSGTRARSDGQQEGYLIPAALLANWVVMAKRIFDIERLARRFNYYFTPLQVIGFPQQTQIRCLDIPNGDPTDGTPINQFTCHWGLNQQWVRDYRADPTWAPFVSNATGKCLGLSGNGPGPITEQTCDGSDRQKFREIQTSGRFQYVARVGNNLCLSATGGLANGVGLSAVTCGASILTTQVFSRHVP